MCLRKVKIILFISLCIIVSIASQVIAATYFVDATNGKDTYDGLSPEKAWKTIRKVKGTTFEPGDEIRFKRGEVFSDSILFVYSSGSEGKPIVFRDYGDLKNPLPVITYSHNFCIWMRDREYLTFQNLDVAGGGEAVIELKQSAIGKTHHIVIKDCIIRGGNTGVWVDTALGGLVEGCEIYDCKTGFSSHDPGFTVRDCKIHDNQYGISVGTYDTIIEGNEIFNNEIGIRYGFGYGKFDVTFRHNLVRDNKSHGFETWYGVVNAGTITYNIFSGNGGDGIFLKNSVSGITIFNNVISGNKGHGINLAVEKDKAPHGITIKNNIIMDNKGYEIRIAKGVTGLESDYNCVYRVVSGPLTEWSGTGYSWNDWKKHSQQDVHSINRNPLFFNSPSGDFRLAVKSPCRNAGVNLDLEEMDYYGNPVPSSGVAIGVDQGKTAESDTDKAASSH